MCPRRDNILFGKSTKLEDLVNIEQSVLEKLRALPPEQQQEVLDFAEFLGQKHATAKRSRRNWKGLAFDLNVDLTSASPPRGVGGSPTAPTVS